MSTQIKFKTALTKEDFVKASRGYLLSQVNNQVFGVLLVLLILAGVLGLIRNGVEPSILTFVILATFGLVYSYFISPAIGASTIASHSEWNSGNDWSVTQNEIIINSRAVGAKVGWDLFQDFIETKGYFLLIHSENKKLFQVIPKRVFKSPDQEEEFRQVLKTRYDKQRKPFLLRNWRLILIVLVLLSVNAFAMYALGKSR